MSGSLPFKEDDIKNELLIQEVEKRASLYNNTLKRYGDHNLKLKLWDEVACLVFAKFWNDLSQEQKLEAVRVTQRRWKNLRCCFSRELREQKRVKAGYGSVRRRKYIYHDQLAFLLPLVEPRYDNITPMSEDTRTDETGGEEEQEFEVAPFNEVYIKPNMKNDCDYEQNAEVIEEVKVEAANNDEDTYFLLSLVPKLKALSPDRKLDVQISILQLFRNASSST